MACHMPTEHAAQPQHGSSPSCAGSPLCSPWGERGCHGGAHPRPAPPTWGRGWILVWARIFQQYFAPKMSDVADPVPCLAQPHGTLPPGGSQPDSDHFLPNGAAVFFQPPPARGLSGTRSCVCSPPWHLDLFSNSVSSANFRKVLLRRAVHLARGSEHWLVIQLLLLFLNHFSLAFCKKLLIIFLIVFQLNCESTFHMSLAVAHVMSAVSSGVIWLCSVMGCFKTRPRKVP